MILRRNKIHFWLFLKIVGSFLAKSTALCYNIIIHYQVVGLCSPAPLKNVFLIFISSDIFLLQTYICACSPAFSTKIIKPFSHWPHTQYPDGNESYVRNTFCSALSQEEHTLIQFKYILISFVRRISCEKRKFLSHVLWGAGGWT